MIKCDIICNQERGILGDIMKYPFLTDKETEFLDFNIQELKELIVKKFSYYMVNQTEETKIKYLQYSVLSSWFSDINTYDDFVKKFESFSNVLRDEEVKELFQNVKHISTINDESKEEKIEETIRKYIDTTSTISYQTNTETSGYSLSNMYLESDKYKDLSLHKNVYFTNLLYTYLIKIDKHFKELQQQMISQRESKEIKSYNRKMKYGKKTSTSSE